MKSFPFVAVSLCVASLAACSFKEERGRSTRASACSSDAGASKARGSLYPAGAPTTTTGLIRRVSSGQ